MFADSSPSPSDATRHIDQWLAQALHMGASDLHFETTPTQFRIRFRIDGKLHIVATPPQHLRDAVLSCLKVMARLDIGERRLPQDGRFRHPVGAQHIDLRVSSLPTLQSEKIVLRVLNHHHTLPSFEALGLQTNDANVLQKALHKAHGMVLFTGATGSGKTLSLNSCLNLLNQADINISTVEDPCEIRLEGINQTAVNDKINLSFANCLRALLRQDPDVLMVGEIRDSETARIATQAAQTGHLVLSTLHANDAPAAITRLQFMGIESFNIASGLSLVVAQRLIRLLCEACKKADSHTASYTAVGCALCTQGYKDRGGVFQLMPITPRLQHLIAQDASDIDLNEAAQHEGMRTLLQDGWDKVTQGITSAQELTALSVDV